MVCRYCGNDIRKDSKYCSSCGASIDETELQESSEMTDTLSFDLDAQARQKKKKTMGLVIVFLAVILVAAIIAASMFLTSFLSEWNMISSIKNAVPTTFPDAGTWGDALDEYCDDTNWNYVKAKDEENGYVDFKGKIKDTGEELYIKFEFTEKNRYNITEFEVDDKNIINDSRIEKIANDLFG